MLSDNLSLKQKIIDFFNKINKNTNFMDYDCLDEKKKRSLTNISNDFIRNELSIEDCKGMEPLIENEVDRDLLEIEKRKLEINCENLIERAKEELLCDDRIKESVVVEIRPGAGGTEAGLFVRDLYRMYAKLADKRKWKLELAESMVDQLGNFTRISFLLKGKNIYKWLKNEGGIHRVQRVPKTESKGRIHTSTASVVFLPEPSEIAFQINPSDLQIETYGAGGPGGQHVNKTQSAIRITHKPTGIVATSQDSRDQRVNRERALSVLKTRILEKLEGKKKTRRRQTSFFYDRKCVSVRKIRTYNWPDNRVTDHRLKISWKKLDLIIEGECEEILQKLVDYEAEKIIDGINEKLAKTSNQSALF